MTAILVWDVKFSDTSNTMHVCWSFTFLHESEQFLVVY